MRNAKFFGSVMVLLFLTNALFATPGNKKVEKEESVAHLQIKLEDEIYLSISGEGKLVVTPSANFLKTYKFQLTDAEMA
ncbi:MAG TPA: hypothetical protein VKA10_08975, partial [Prolixibacteraceae bacterium]|nr:hypothetical protein [Prolixibacteraceae bacterium]